MLCRSILWYILFLELLGILYFVIVRLVFNNFNPISESLNLLIYFLCTLLVTESSFNRFNLVCLP